jgi:hypothetical protein
MTQPKATRYSYADCYLCWVSFTLIVTFFYRYAECGYAECRYAERRGAIKQKLKENCH